MSISSLSLFFLAVTCNLAASQNEERGRVVCYYEQWAIYRGTGGTLAPKDIHPFLCTHLIYSFAEAVEKEATLNTTDKTADFDKNGYRDFIDLRAKYNEKLKVLLAIGGYNAGSHQFTPISAKPESRQLFARNSLDYLRKYGFDGLNIDWQFPNDEAIRGGAAEDFKNFPLLLKDIKKVFEEEAASTGNSKLLLTISVPGKIDIIESGHDLAELQKYVEFMNVLCYDYHYAYDPWVNHHSPIYPLPDEVTGSGHENEGHNADATINYILSKGIQPDKLNLGIPLYGRGFTLVDENQVTLGSPATGQGNEGKATRETGYKAYFELCKDLEKGYVVQRPNETAMGPFAYKGNQWFGYDDEKSVRRKGEYAKKKGLGGMSFWAIDQDDFSATCGTTAYPLIKAAKDGYDRAKKPISATKPPAVPQVSAAPTISTIEVTPSPSTQRPISAPNVNIPSPRTKLTAEVSSYTGETSNLPADYDDPAVDAYTTPEASTPNAPTTIDAPSGLFRNVYVWITNNIYHHSPITMNFDGSAHSNKRTHNASPTTPGLSQGRPEVDSEHNILGRTKDGVEPFDSGDSSLVSSNIGAPSQATPDTGSTFQASPETATPFQLSSDTGAPSQASPGPGAPSQVSSDTGAPSQASPGTGAPSQVSSDTGAPSQASPGTGAPSHVSSDTGAPSQTSPDTAGAPSQASPDTGAPSQVSPDTGAPSQASPGTGAPSQVSSDTGAPSQASPGTGAPSQVSSDTGAPSQTSPDTAGAPSQASPDTGAPFQVPPANGAPSQVPSNNGAPAQVYNTGASSQVSSGPTILTGESSASEQFPEESPWLEISTGKLSNPEIATERSPNAAGVTATSTDISVVHVTSQKSINLIDIPSTISTPKLYTHYYNGLPIWST